MARQEMFVDLAKLKLVIDELENGQIAKGAPAHKPFRSRSELYKAVAGSDWGQSIGLSPVVVATRIDRYGIDCKTGVRARVMTVAPIAAPIASTTPVNPENAAEAEPDAGPTYLVPVAPVSVQRRSVYKGIDLEAFIAPFAERGIEVNGLSSIVTSGLHTKSVNLKIQAAWHDLRERFNIPRVKDKPQEVESVLPLDQVRLPGEPVFGEPISVESEPVFGEPVPVESESVFGELVDDLPTDEELAVEEFPELYDQESNEFYDPATDERTLDHIQESLGAINQEDESVADQGFRTDLLPPLSEILAANNGGLLPEAGQGGEFQTTEELPSGPFPEPGLYQNIWSGWQPSGEPQTAQEPLQDALQEDHLATGEFPLDEPQEVYPEREDPRDVDRELEEWLNEGGALQDASQNGNVEAADSIQDEYLPLDMEEDMGPAVYDPNSVPAEFESEDFDGSGIEVEETDPNETR